MKKLWLDDVRPPPDLSWTWINNAPAAYNAVLQLDIDDKKYNSFIKDYARNKWYDGKEYYSTSY